MPIVTKKEAKMLKTSIKLRIFFSVQSSKVNVDEISANNTNVNIGHSSSSMATSSANIMAAAVMASTSSSLVPHSNQSLLDTCSNNLANLTPGNNNSNSCNLTNSNLSSNLNATSNNLSLGPSGASSSAGGASTSKAAAGGGGPVMNNGSRDMSGRDMSAADLQKLQQQLQDIKEQVTCEKKKKKKTFTLNNAMLLTLCFTASSTKDI